MKKLLVGVSLLGSFCILPKKLPASVKASLMIGLRVDELRVSDY